MAYKFEKVKSVEERLDNLEAIGVGNKLDVQQGHINALVGRAYNLEGRASALEAADTGIKERLDTLEQSGGDSAELDALKGRVDVLEDRPLVLVDSSLSQPNYAADAKAVGQKFNEYATKTYVDSAVANSGGGGGAGIGTYSANLAYTLKDNDEYELSGIGTCTDTYLVIPSIVNSKKVTSIGASAFENNKKIVGVTIPNSVTVINADAFLNCQKLERVEIPEGVTTIGQQAFSYCYKLASVTIPKSVTTIAKHAFLYSYQNNLTIYCEAESKPSGWDADWNADNFPVVWGAALDFASVNGKLASGGSTGGGGASVELDTTLTQAGKAADAKAVGDAINGVEVYVTGMSDEPIPLGIALQNEGYSYDMQIVDALPDQLTLSDTSANFFHLYLLRSDGVLYLDAGAGTMTLGKVFVGVEGYDKGWTTDLYSKTGMGVYSVRKVALAGGLSGGAAPIIKQTFSKVEEFVRYISNNPVYHPIGMEHNGEIGITKDGATIGTYQNFFIERIERNMLNNIVLGAYVYFRAFGTDNTAQFRLTHDRTNDTVSKSCTVTYFNGGGQVWGSFVDFKSSQQLTAWFATV